MEAMKLNGKGIKIKEKRDGLGIFASCYLVFQLVILLSPFIWALLASFKTNLDLRYNCFGLPKKWMTSNYTDVLSAFKWTYNNGSKTTSYNFGNMLLNSVAYCFVGSLVPCITIYLVAYIRNAYNFRLLRLLDVIVLFVTTVPIVGNLPASISMFKTLGLIDNFFGMTVIARISFTYTYYFIMGAVIKSISKTYIEAAEVDGANQFQLLTRIMFPLTASIFFTVFMFLFIDNWNNYTVSYIYLKNFPTAAFGLWYFKQQTTAEAARVPMKLAASFIVALPMLVLFVIFHKRIMNGLSFEGGVKE